MSTPFTLVELETSEAEIAAVEQAIASMDAGTYGACLECGIDLTDEVAARPLTALCAAHQF